MDRDEEILLGRRRKRVWIGLFVSIPFLAAMAGGVWFFLSQRREAQNEVIVENVTGAAFGCVASLRGDAPEAWGLERALEHMSRMERVTRDEDDPTTREERERFARLAADAARGCEELGRLMMGAQRDETELYFGVPAQLAQPPDQADPERWFRRVMPKSREAVLELTRQIRVMAEQINARRTERQLMAQQLPIEGRGPTELARLIELTAPPRERERIQTEVWPLPDYVYVVRRGSIPAVPCDTRFINRASCFNEFVQTVGWDGQVSELRALTRPSRVTYWSAFTPTPDGSLWAVGIDSRNRGIVGRYPPDATEPELSRLDATVDAATNIVAVAGGVAIFPTDGSAWLAEDALAFTRVETTPPPLIVTMGHGGADQGLRFAGLGTLSLFGSEEAGWTSRFSPVEDDGEEVLLRVIDANRRVREVVALRSLRSGKAVALLQRFHESPDAIMISEDFGRTWLSDPQAPSAD